MKRFLVVLVCISVSLSLVACAAKQVSLRENPSVKKVALVSLSVSDWGGSVRAGSVGNTPVQTLIEKSTREMLNYSEKVLATRWEVKPAVSFINGSDYRKQGVERTLSVLVPSVKGKEMPIFTQVSKEIKRGDLDPARAQALCKSLKVDAVVLVFSEWTYKTGGFVPITKAVTKNIVSVWDKAGNKLAMRRLDMMGDKPLGAMGIKAVNETTIAEWVGTYKSSFGRIVKDI